MGGGTGSNSYQDLILIQPWGEVAEQVRIFPPCEVDQYVNRNNSVTIFVKDRTNMWKRKQIDSYDYFPKTGFIAWDDRNQEYAWHEVGTIDVPSAKDPKVEKFVPIIRGETEPLTSGAGIPPRARGRRRFIEWWESKSRANETPDYLRRK